MKMKLICRALSNRSTNIFSDFILFKNQTTINLLKKSKFKIFILIENENQVMQLVLDNFKRIYDCQFQQFDKLMMQKDTFNLDKSSVIYNIYQKDIKWVLNRVHGQESIVYVLRLVEPTLLEFNNKLQPVYVGWFCNDHDNDIIAKSSKKANNVISEAIKSQLEWTAQVKRFHVTSHFLGCSHDPYSTNSFGRYADIKITGLLMTKRTFSGHCKLSKAAKPQFYDQNMVNLKPHMTLALSGCVKPVDAGKDQVEIQKLIAADFRPLETLETKLGELADYGDERYYLTLKEPWTFSLLLMAHY